MKKRYWLRGGLLGLVVLALVVVTIAMTVFRPNSPEPEGFVKWFPVVTWLPGHYLGLLIPGTRCLASGGEHVTQMPEVCLNDGLVGALIVNPILYFAVGALIGRWYGKRKERQMQSSLAISS